MPRKRKRFILRKPALYISKILAWADEYRKRKGRLPAYRSAGLVEGQGDLTWLAVEMALRKGLRGLPGGMTLATLLEEHRGHRHHFKTPRLSIPRILKWMDAYKGRTGKFPDSKSGAVLEAPGETWAAINAALLNASRGIKTNSSLAMLLAKYRGHRHYRALPRLSEAQIVEWARAWRVLYGVWPASQSGVIGNTRETWVKVDVALRNGLRGLSGGSSLSRLIRARVRE